MVGARLLRDLQWVSTRLGTQCLDFQVIVMIGFWDVARLLTRLVKLSTTSDLEPPVTMWRVTVRLQLASRAPCDASIKIVHQHALN